VFSSRGKWGYIDKQGNWVISPRYSTPPGEFHGGLAAVQTDGGWRFINKSAQVIESIPASAIEPPPLSEGLILCAKSKETQKGRYPTSADFTYEYVDTAGRIVMTPKIVSGGRFSEGLAAAMFPKASGDKSLWGYIDGSGEPVIDGKYYSAGDFKQGLAVVWVDAEFEGKGGLGSYHGGKFGYIDKTGKFVIEPTFDSARAFSDNGLAAAGGNYIDKTGKVILKGPYWKAGDFNDGLAPVASSGAVDTKFGFITRDGKWAAKPTWDDAESFSEGLAGVGTNTGKFEDETSQQWPIFKYGFVDKTFKVVIPQKFLAVRKFSEGLAAAASE